MKSTVWYIVVLCCFFAACNNGDNFLLEDDPVLITNDVDDHEFVIRGDINGEEFLLNHESSVQFNSPSNFADLYSYFGTAFRLEYPGDLAETIIVFGLTNKDVNASFEDIVRPGTYDWYNFALPNQSVGQAVVDNVTFEGDRDMTNLPLANFSPDNYFEITSVTPLELDENLEETYNGNIYNVEGHFSIELEKWDNSGEMPRLTVEYFSAIFYDDRS